MLVYFIYLFYLVHVQERRSIVRLNSPVHFCSTEFLNVMDSVSQLSELLESVSRRKALISAVHYLIYSFRIGSLLDFFSLKVKLQSIIVAHCVKLDALGF